MIEQLKAALIEHLVHDRNPLHREVLCKKMERIGLIGGEIPCRPFWEWDEALKALVAEGSVIAAGERVEIDRVKYGAPAVGKNGMADDKRRSRPVQAQGALF